MSYRWTVETTQVLLVVPMRLLVAVAAAASPVADPGGLVAVHWAVVGLGHGNLVAVHLVAQGGLP